MYQNEPLIYKSINLQTFNQYMCDENQIGVIQLYWAHKAVLLNLLQNKCIKSGKCLQHIQQKNKNIQNRKKF